MNAWCSVEKFIFLVLSHQDGGPHHKPKTDEFWLHLQVAMFLETTNHFNQKMSMSVMT